VISSTDGATLRSWLTTNGYYVSDDSGKIIDDYVANQFAFVAVRLQPGQEASAIRPIVLHMAATEACLPLKLTAIASTPDLRINVWVLAGARAVPLAYSEIEINQAKLDWFTGGSNYDQLLKDAANEAQGDAFAVEYAMPANNSTTWFTLPTYARSDLASATTPPAFMASLARDGLTPTGAVLQILRKYIPEPAGLVTQGTTEATFYANINYYWGNNMAAFAAFDPVAATAEMDTDVFTPMDSYRQLFARAGTLTRLATFISPEEMTKDPLFVTNASLPNVAPQHVAVAHVMCGDGTQVCNAPVRRRTEDGQDVNYAVKSCMQYDRGDLDQKLPASTVAWTRSSDGDGQMVVDNRAMIASALKAHNESVPVPVQSPGGCGCTTGGSPGLMVWLTMAAGGIAVWRRRRHRR